MVGTGSPGMCLIAFDHKVRRVVNVRFWPKAASHLAFATSWSSRPACVGIDFSLVVYEPGLCYPDILGRLRIARNPDHAL